MSGFNDRNREQSEPTLAQKAVGIAIVALVLAIGFGGAGVILFWLLS